MFLSRSQVPIAVLVTYRRLLGSNSSSAPSSEAASWAFVFSRRTARRRAKSTRCSQSTAIVAPREAMVMISPPELDLFSDSAHGLLESTRLIARKRAA